MALRLNTSEKNEIMPRRKARAEKPRLAQMLLRSGSLAGVESIELLKGFCLAMKDAPLSSLVLSLFFPFFSLRLGLEFLLRGFGGLGFSPSPFILRQLITLTTRA